MTVYVDDMKAPYRGMVMCHMLADTTDELLAMVDRIGVQRKWIQHRGTPHEHFDICSTKRAKAVAAGAIEITRRQAAMMCAVRAATGALPSPQDATHMFFALKRPRGSS